MKIKKISKLYFIDFNWWETHNHLVGEMKMPSSSLQLLQLLLVLLMLLLLKQHFSLKVKHYFGNPLTISSSNLTSSYSSRCCCSCSDGKEMNDGKKRAWIFVAAAAAVAAVVLPEVFSVLLVLSPVLLHTVFAVSRLSYTEPVRTTSTRILAQFASHETVQQLHSVHFEQKHHE